MIPIKTPGEIKTMAEGGRRLGRIKKALEEKIGEEVRASDMEELAVDLIEKEDGKINAFLEINPHALEEARAIDAKKKGN